MNLCKETDKDNHNQTIKNHVFVWIIYWLLQLWWRFDTHNVYDIMASAIQVITWAIVFYSLRLYLYPKYLWKNHWKLFFFMLISYFVFVEVSMIYTNYLMIASDGKDAKIFSLMMFSKRGLFWYFNMSFVAFGFTYYDELGKTKEKILIEEQKRLLVESELQKTQLTLKKSELENLKAQFNPHFLFNSLWYVYALVSGDGNEKATKAIELLAEMMRYSMKSRQVNEFVPLEEELNYANNYIELQRLRTPMMQLDYQVKGNLVGVTILPLVMISFVENACKHGKLNEEENPLTIHLTVEENKDICFFVKNKISTLGRERSSGIGLENVKKRLQTAYRDKHTLEITNTQEFYTSKLTIKS